MTISLKQLRYFQAVVETGNYSRAAERLCVAQSAVSRQIKELEEAVQALLLKRTTRQVCLTPAGEAFYQGCQQIIDQLELTLAETRHAERGGLHTMQLLHSSSVPLSGVLLTALRQHLQKHPDLVCEVTTVNSEQQAADIEERRADVGVAVVAASMRDQAPADVFFVPLAGDGGSTVAVMHHREAAPVIKHFVATLGELVGKQPAAIEHS